MLSKFIIILILTIIGRLIAGQYLNRERARKERIERLRLNSIENQNKVKFTNSNEIEYFRQRLIERQRQERNK